MRIAAGELHTRIRPRGHDELTDLGWALNEMVARGEAARVYETTQREFDRRAQVSETEGDTYGLLKRHLERSIPRARSWCSTATTVRIGSRRPPSSRPSPTRGAVGDGAAPRLSGRSIRSAARRGAGRGAVDRLRPLPPPRRSDVVQPAPGGWGGDRVGPVGSRRTARRRTSPAREGLGDGPRPSSRTSATSPSRSSARQPISRRGYRTHARSRTRSSCWWPRLPGCSGPWGRCCWTSTTSRTSTTRSATGSATRCWRPLAWPCSRRCARATSSVATAARSSSCCCRTPTAKRPSSGRARPHGDRKHQRRRWRLGRHRELRRRRLPGGRPDVARLVRNADRALYRAKANGRNRVEVFTVDDATQSESGPGTNAASPAAS